MKSALYVTALALACAGFGFADTVVQTIGSGNWFAPVTADNSGNAFWNNQSADGSTCNVGYILQSAGNICGGPTAAGYTAPGALSFLGGVNAATPDAGFAFTNSGSTNVRYVASIAGDDGGNPGESFGYGLVGVPNSQVTLFAVNNQQAPGSPTGSFSVAAGQQFYFFLNVNGNTTYTTSANGAQFALFAQSPSVSGSDAGGTALNQFWIGSEDTALPGGDRDYNDFVVGLTTSATPEPGFYGLLAVGLCGIGLTVRRRQVQE